MSVKRDRLRQKSWYPRSVSVWQHVKLSYVSLLDPCARYTVAGKDVKNEPTQLKYMLICYNTSLKLFAYLKCVDLLICYNTSLKLFAYLKCVDLLICHNTSLKLFAYLKCVDLLICHNTSLKMFVHLKCVRLLTGCVTH